MLVRMLLDIGFERHQTLAAYVTRYMPYAPYALLRLPLRVGYMGDSRGVRGAAQESMVLAAVLQYSRLFYWQYNAEY